MALSFLSLNCFVVIEFIPFSDLLSFHRAILELE